MAKDVYFRNVPPDHYGEPQNRTNSAQPAQTNGTQRTRQAGDYRQQPSNGGSAARPRQTVQPQRNTAQNHPVYTQQPVPRRQPQKQKKKRHVFRNLVIILLLLCLLGGAVAAATGIHVSGRLLQNYTPVPMNKGNYADPALLMHSDDVYNILLMGVDQADLDSASRSDSMILLSIDKKHRQLKLTTFMRDMYVYIPGYGNTKLTHAHMYEGPQLTVDTIELNFNVRIDAYAKIGYDIFIELVDCVGGITVAQIDETEARALAEEHVYVDPGHNIHLNGEQAIKYVRIRHWQSDFARTERQREAVTLIIEQAKHTSPVKLLALAESIAGKIECTIPKKELVPLLFSVLPCLKNGIAQQQIPADGTWWDATRDGLMVLELDFDKNKAILNSFIYGG